MLFRLLQTTLYTFLDYTNFWQAPTLHAILIRKIPTITHVNRKQLCCRIFSCTTEPFISTITVYDKYAFYYGVYCLLRWPPLDISTGITVGGRALFPGRFSVGGVSLSRWVLCLQADPLPLWTEWLTQASENITLPQSGLQEVKMHISSLLCLTDSVLIKWNTMTSGGSRIFLGKGGGHQLPKWVCLPIISVHW